ncbi:MAG: type I-E CRISPR-associated protein Cse1/CasA [Hyphomicrobiaceae bacterium]
MADRFAQDPIVALDFPRPDWNAAVLEFLIGLYATALPPRDTAQWVKPWVSPAEPEALAGKLQPMTFAFNLDGEGPRCFQDFDPLAGLEPKPVSALLIDAPGENAEKKNTDLFVKRTGETVMSLPMAAAALITLQTYAPAGGQGNRTSLRGGGPLTTLPLPRRKVAAAAITTLWDLVWAAVPNSPDDIDLPADTNDPEWALIFPWLAPARTSEKDRSTQPEDHANRLQQYFATPRRIRLDFAPADGAVCAFEGVTGEVVVRTFRQKNFGVKYDGWQHPLSPYRVDDEAGKIAFHPQPGGATFRDWMTWVEILEGKAQRATCLDSWNERVKWLRSRSDMLAKFRDDEPWQSGVLAFGYDMDNMKARGWLEARIPFFDAPDGVDETEWASSFRFIARRLVAGTEEAAKALRTQVKVALYGQRNREDKYRIPDTVPREAASELIEGLWRACETDFRKALDDLRSTPDDKAKAIRIAFKRALTRHAFARFDTITGIDTLADQDAKRLVTTRSMLQAAFGERGSVAHALDLPEQKPGSKRVDKSKKGPSQ